MLRFFYETLLPLTMVGSATMLLLFALAPLEKRMSSRWRYYMRLVPLVLFTVPFAFALPFLQRPAAQLEAVPVHTLAAMGELLGEAVVQPFAAPAASPVSPAGVLALLWALGVLVLVCRRLFVWLSFNALAFRHSTAVSDKALLRQFDDCREQMGVSGRVRIRICSRIGGPMLIGILRPVVLLPCGGAPKREMRLILLHELTHCKRADLAFKLAALAVKTIHWFNPLAYLLAKQVGELCELSCDEALVRGMDNNQRRRYAFTILNQMDNALCKIPEVASGFSGGKDRVKRRINLIMTFKKPKRLILAAGICSALCLCTAGVFASSALNADNTAQTSSSGIAESSIILGQSTAAPKQDIQAKNQTSAEPKRGQEVLTPDAEAKSTEDNSTLIAEDDVLQELTAEEEIAAAKKKSDAAEKANEPVLKALKLIWPIGKLGETEVDTITVTEKAASFITTAIWDYRGHTGTDITAPKDSEILAAADGKVIKAEETPGGYGKHIIISHEGGMTTLYGHCSELLAAVGDEVKQGDVIAKMGRTGNTSGYNCHFELRSGGSYLDARNYIGYKAP